MLLVGGFPHFVFCGVRLEKRRDCFLFDELVKSHEVNYRWLSKKVYPPLAAP